MKAKERQMKKESERKDMSINAPVVWMELETLVGVKTENLRKTKPRPF
jgi:hypothetical protein